MTSLGFCPAATTFHGVNGPRRCNLPVGHGGTVHESFDPGTGYHLQWLVKPKAWPQARVWNEQDCQHYSAWQQHRDLHR